MKRIALNIQSKNRPNQNFTGYAVVDELSNEALPFFTTEKFEVDDVLMMNFRLGDEQYEYPVSIKALHEQISTRRILTSLPTDENPFPSPKFYRAYGKVVKQTLQSQTDRTVSLKAVNNQIDEASSPPLATDSAPASNGAMTQEEIDALLGNAA